MGLLALPQAQARPEPTLQERSDWERQVLGLPVSVHPLQLVAKELEHMALTHSDELGRHTGENVTLAGVRLAAHRLTSRHEPLLLVDMEDEHGLYQVLWSGAALDRATRDGLLARREPVLVRGRVRTDRQGQVVVAGHEIKAIP
jgi:DNA polymerase III alpha subunit